MEIAKKSHIRSDHESYESPASQKKYQKWSCTEVGTVIATIAIGMIVIVGIVVSSNSDDQLSFIHS